ncbi:MAK10-like protein [Tanacetum coccineum]|uniref:MAK10-like protein n=1 Tax=Tanacetum coccineum TaxID=301880 RepID=A0ABQ5HSC2_9ASTR
MGDENPIRTLGDYSKPSHEGYRNTIELPVGNNVVPLRSDTIRLVQNGCSFHGLRSEDPNQHLKDFLKLVDSLDLDGDNRERTRLRLFQFSLRDQASNWLERLPAGSITTWEDLTTRFLAQFFPPGRTAKLCNDILMFQQHHGESLSEAWTRFKDLLQNVPHHGIDLWPQAITLPQDVASTSDHHLIELENQVQRLMEAHLALTQPAQENKITTSCEICNGPHDTQYCMENPEQAFVDYASSRTDKVGGSSMAPKNIVAISHDKKEELRKKGIKSPSKFFSPKYLSPASITELNKNSSAPKCVHFVNSIVILSRDNDTENEDVSSTYAHEHNLGSIMRRNEEVKEEGQKEDEIGTDEEIKEVFEDEESEWETEEEVEEVFDDETEEEDGDTKHYNSLPGEFIFGKPFIEETGLVYNKEEGTIAFGMDNEKITFKMPHTLEMFKQSKLKGLNTDSIPPAAYEDNFGQGRTHYYQSVLIGDEYRHDEGDKKGIRHLMKLEKEMMEDEGEVT